MPSKYKGNSHIRTYRFEIKQKKNQPSGQAQCDSIYVKLIKTKLIGEIIFIKIDFKEINSYQINYDEIYPFDELHFEEINSNEIV